MNRYLRYALLGLAAFLLAGFLCIVYGACRVFGSEDLGREQGRVDLTSMYGISLIEDEDAVEHAWQSDHWMDSERRYLIRTTPERVAAIRAKLLADDKKRYLGRSVISVSLADPRDEGTEDEARMLSEIWSRGRHPDWWEPGELEAPQYLSYSIEPEKPGGGSIMSIRVILSEPDGLVYVIRWHT